jgi:Protein of unknown function (DUF1488)
MNINFPPGETYDFDRDSIAFPVDVNGQRIRVYVSSEALQDHFGATDPSEYLGIFKRHRSHIEDMARRVIEQLGPSNDLVLKTEFF